MRSVFVDFNAIEAQHYLQLKTFSVQPALAEHNVRQRGVECDKVQEIQRSGSADSHEKLVCVRVRQIKNAHNQHVRAAKHLWVMLQQKTT